MPSLQQSEAVERARLITVTDSVVELDLSPDGEMFGSTATLTVDCTEDGAATFVDFKGESLLSVTLNGEPVAAEGWQDGRIALTGLRRGRNLLAVTGEMRYSSDGEGLHRHIDGSETYLYAMSFLDAAPRWFACFDQPDLKSPYTFVVTAPEAWVVRGNGPAVSEPVAGRDGVVRWRIAQPVPLSTYFTTLVAGDYATVSGSHDGITLGLLARRDLAAELEAQATDILEVTAACFDAFHQLFGVRYPFGEYHQAFVPDFNAGAMENPGCVTFRDQYLFRGASTQAERGNRACTIAHEMAHQWFGDLVTMQWWDDLWLNESFAEYLGHRVCSEATRYPRWEEFGVARKDWGRVADQAETSHPIAGNGAADAQAALANFDGISYAKGAAVLKQLVAYVGDEAFFAGLGDYFGRYGRGNASFGDLLDCWRTAAADRGDDVDLDAWAGAWLTTQGLDRIDAERDGDQIVVHRTPPADQPADRVHLFGVARVAADGSVLEVVEVRTEGDVTRIDAPGEEALLIPDADDRTWARVITADPDAIGSIGRLRPSLARLVLYNALRDGVREVETDPAEALSRVVAALPHETTVEFVRDLGAFAVNQLSGTYAAPEVRADRRAVIAEAIDRVLADADQGSDRQLVALRLSIACCDDAERLDALIAGDWPAGIAEDRELMWQAVTRRVSLPVEIDRAEETIVAALRRDPSSAGRLHAVTARASVPTREAKQRAYEIVMAPSMLSAYEVYAAAEGLFQTHQHDLTRPFVAPFFSGVDATKSFRSGWALARVIAQAFPYGHADPESLAAAEQAIAAPGADPAVVRALRDATDRLRRAVASRQRFGGSAAVD